MLKRILFIFFYGAINGYIYIFIVGCISGSLFSKIILKIINPFFWTALEIAIPFYVILMFNNFVLYKTKLLILIHEKIIFLIGFLFFQYLIY